MLSFTGTNEEAIIKVLTNHSGSQRKEIADYYKTAFGQVSKRI